MILWLMLACSQPSETRTEPTTTRCDDSEADTAFQALWADFDSRYAVFAERLDDGRWSELLDEGCASVDAHTTDDALFDAMLDLVRNLDDGHVNLIAADLGRAEDAWVSAYPHYRELYGLELGVERHYLDAPLSWDAEDWFAWGRRGDIGYVSITSFDGLSRSGSEGADREAAAAAMEAVLDDLGDTSGMIVDVRANEGGWDAVSLEVATWFAGSRTLAWTKQRRDGPAHDDFTPWMEVFVEEGGSEAYTGPVVLLTSGGTFSAAETFAMAMRVRDDVTLLGEPTSGHLSDLYDGKLENGWRYTLSGERYQAADGAIYEGIGIPVDVHVDLHVDDLADGRDAMMDAALERLGGL